MQWADPVTGSSGMPDWGAKKRETKSHASPAAVTITPRVSSKASSVMSGSSARTSASLASTAMMSWPRQTSWTGLRSASLTRPVSSTRPPSRLGKSMMKSSPARRTSSTPLRVWNRKLSRPAAKWLAIT
jgi:hypothetical protein